MRHSGASFALSGLAYRLLCVAFLASLAVTLWMTFYSPVNADELFWKIMISRLDADDGNLVYLFAQCRQGQWIEAPLTWYPAMWVNSLLYEDASEPWELRVHGWLLFIVLLGLWSWLLSKRSGLSRLDSLVAVSAVLSVGVMPFLMVYERPEQPLLLLLTLALMTTLGQGPAPGTTVSWTRGLLVMAGFGLVAALMSGTHPKGMFLFPVLIVLAWRQLRSVPLITVLIVLMGWVAFDTNQVWQLRTTCPEYPGLSKVLKNLTLRPSMLLSDPMGFIRAGWANLMAFDAYVNSLKFQPSYVSTWLPNALSDWSPDTMRVMVANSLLWVPLVVMGGVTLGNVLGRRRPQTIPDALLCLTLLMAVGAIVILQTAKNFYESSIVWPLILLVGLFSFGKPLQRPSGPTVRVILAALMMLALLSGVLRYERFENAMQEWREIRTEQVEEGEDRNEALQELGYQRCSIDPEAERLVLDRDSYQAFWEHKHPVFLDYAAGWWGAEADFLSMARTRQVGGLVGRCNGVPKELWSVMVRGAGSTQGFCCVAPQHLR